MVLPKTGSPAIAILVDLSLDWCGSWAVENDSRRFHVQVVSFLGSVHDHWRTLVVEFSEVQVGFIQVLDCNAIRRGHKVLGASERHLKPVRGQDLHCCFQR